MAPGDIVVEAKGLIKRYGDLVAVAGIDLHATTGSCLGILGPNGAGKTTTIETLEGIKKADAGEIRILGTTWADGGQSIRERIGVQLQETELQPKLTCRETLRLFASFYSNPHPFQDILQLVGLEEKQNGFPGELSGGQKQRLSLGCALINQPEILFLDEPSTGLDPQARRQVWEVVETFKRRGGTVLLTTHYMEEAEKLADQLVIFDHGKIIAEGSPASIIASLGAESILQIRPRGEHGEALAALDPESLAGVKSIQPEPGGRLRLSVDDTQASIRSLLAWLEDAGIALEELHTYRPTLEDVFVSLTGKQLRDA